MGNTTNNQNHDGVGNILKTLRFASSKHRNQRRKDKEASPYINHPIAVADVLRNIGAVHDINIIVAALLHDTLEDTDTTYEELKHVFGEDVADMVQEVSDDKNLPKMERKRLQIENAPSKSQGAKCIKLADFISNMSDLNHFPPERWSATRRKEYLDWCQAVVTGLRGANAALEAKFDEILARWVTVQAPPEGGLKNSLKTEEGISSPPPQGGGK